MSGQNTTREIWIISGEASGDLYGARIANEIRKRSPETHIAGMGGVKMKDAGVEIIVDSTELGVIGIVEIMGSIFKFIKIFFHLVAEAKKRRPAEVILVDYPGFNLRFAKMMWKAGIPVVWYISPQVWAWRKGNIKKLAKYCRKLLAILPFEPEVYEGSGLDVEFVGHPLIDIVKERSDASITRDKDTVLILPGSRRKEIKYLLKDFLLASSILKKRNPRLKFVISAPRVSILNMIKEKMSALKAEYPGGTFPDIELNCGETAFWMQKASSALAASGTVTVECAIAGLPTVVAYRLNEMTFLLARLVIRRLFRDSFTIINIILNRKVFHEFLQFQVTPEVLADEMALIMPGGSRRAEVEKDMALMKEMLSAGSSGALARTAEAALAVIDGAR